MSKIIWSAAALAASAPAIAAAPPQAVPPPIVQLAPAAPQVQGPVDAAALAEARALLRDVDYEAQMERTAVQAVDRTFDTMMRELRGRLGEEIPAELSARVRVVLVEHTARLVDELRPVALDGAARIYASHFTADELREIRRIQTNPVMIKLQRLTPELLPELMQIGVAVAMRHTPELNAAMRLVIDQWESEHESRNPPVG